MRDRQETRRTSVKRTNANALLRLGLLAASMLLAAGCTTAPTVPTPPPAPRPATGRQASEAELRALALAVSPLLEELNYPIPRQPDDCRVGLVILPSAAINAAAGPGSQKPCTLFTLGVSDGAVRRLPVDMLRAIIAHELGHVRLGHFETKRARAGTPAIFRRGFDRAEEAEADRFAVDLLRKLEPRYPGACIALVYVFALLGDQPEGPGRWLATHPSPDNRAETAAAGCQRRN
jgi:predicted Zn-dependent protease